MCHPIILPPLLIRAFLLVSSASGRQVTSQREQLSPNRSPSLPTPTASSEGSQNQPQDG